jgi:hypothetical protein
MSAPTSLSPAAARVYDNINAAASPDMLDKIARAVWQEWGKGSFSDDEATFLTGAVDRRRPVKFHRPARGGADACKPVGRLSARIGSKLAPRPCRKRLSGEERTKRRHRKRILGGSSALPDTMRHFYTEGERAVLCIVAGEMKHHGICDLPIDEIADRAGVGRTTAWPQILRCYCSKANALCVVRPICRIVRHEAIHLDSRILQFRLNCAWLNCHRSLASMFASSRDERAPLTLVQRHHGAESRRGLPDAALLGDDRDHQQSRVPEGSREHGIAISCLNFQAKPVTSGTAMLLLRSRLGFSVVFRLTLRAGLGLFCLQARKQAIHAEERCAAQLECIVHAGGA